MTSTEDSLFLENIQEYVEDCNIIVTYKWLSRKLDVPVNTAKQMLYAYLEQDSSVEATYLISGVVSVGDTTENRVCIVRKEELELVRDQLDQVCGVHVFSLQKAPLKDPETLYRSNYDLCSENLASYHKWSTIDCVCDDRRGGGATQTRAPQTQSAPPRADFSAAPAKTAPKATPKTTPKATPKAKKTSTDTSKQQQPSNPKDSKKAPSTSEKAKVQAKPKSNFFSNMKKKKEEKAVASKDDKQKTKQKQETCPAPTKVETKRERVEERDVSEERERDDVETMDVDSPGEQETDSNGTTEPLKCSTNKYQDKVRCESEKTASQTSTSTSVKSSQHQTLDFLNDGDVADGDSDNEDRSSETVASSKPKKKIKKKATTDVVSKKKSTSSSSSETKKRKRVLELSSDEETDNSNQLQKENGGRRRKRVKKMVSKMYVNEDGEMVTERVWESESTDATDEEPTPVSVKNSQENTVSDSPVQKKKKQTSLFRFIKNK